MIPTGFPMRLPPCLQFRPGCQQVAFTLTLLNTRVEHHVLDSSNRDSDHKKVMLPSRTSFSGRKCRAPHRNWPRTINATFSWETTWKFPTIWLLLFVRSIDWINHFSIIRQHGYWPTHGIERILKITQERLTNIGRMNSNIWIVKNRHFWRFPNTVARISFHFFVPLTRKFLK